MDHIGIDLNKKERQNLHPGRGRRAERAARPHDPRSVRRRSRRPPPGLHPPRGVHGERVGGAMSGGLGHEVIVADQNFAPMYATRSRRIKTDRRDARALAEALSAGGLSSRPSTLRCPALCARALDDPRRPGPHPHRVHQCDPRPGPAARLARADRQCRGLHAPRPRPGAAGPAALGARPSARRHAPGQSAARVLGRADRGRRAGRRTRAAVADRLERRAGHGRSLRGRARRRRALRARA